jgi:hypothetical protein
MDRAGIDRRCRIWRSKPASGSDTSEWSLQKGKCRSRVESARVPPAELSLRRPFLHAAPPPPVVLVPPHGRAYITVRGRVGARSSDGNQKHTGRLSVLSNWTLFLIKSRLINSSSWRMQRVTKQACNSAPSSPVGRLPWTRPDQACARRFTRTFS